MIRSIVFVLACLFFSPSLAFPFCFAEAGKAFDINPGLLKGIARVESNLNPSALNKNSNGSVDAGVMQINSYWVSRLGLDSGQLLSDPCYNVMTGAQVLRSCIDSHGYTWESVGCYNAHTRSKRVDYSWKVYKMLKREAARREEAKRHERPSAKTQESASSSLTFSVRDSAGVRAE